MSGILYPILILTLFLIVQILTMMASRKAVLDKNKQQLLDSVNLSNKIYSNEELSILLGEQGTLIQSLQSQVTDLKNKNSSLEVTINSLVKADEKMRHYLPFAPGGNNYISLQFERASRGAILISGSTNGIETLTNILYEVQNGLRTTVNNQGAATISVGSFSCTNTVCTMQLNLTNAWGYYIAISNTKFIS